MSSAETPLALKERLARLTPEQRARLLSRINKGESASKLSPIVKKSPERVESYPHAEYYKASVGQQRMWFLDYYASGTPLYSVPSAFRLKGNLDIDSLESSFHSLMERHSILRTSFVMEDGDLYQVLHQKSFFKLEQLNLEELPLADKNQALEAFLEEKSCHVFDLSEGPPIRAILIQLESDQYVLLTLMHHIMCDGWSRRNFYHDLAEFYVAKIEGRSASLKELGIRSLDYFNWQEDYFKKEGLEGLEKYWKNKLSDFPETLDLPSDHSRPAVESFSGAHSSLLLDSDLISKLKARAQEEGSTLFMILLAAYKALLYRYTGQADLSVGVPIANRQRSEAEDLIGFFVNTLVMRTSFSADNSFREVLRQVKETAVEAFEHQDMPLESLVELLDVKRDASRTPLFQAIFSLQDFPDIVFDLPELESEILPVNTKTSKFDLSMTLEPEGDSWNTIIEYNTDLFDADRIGRMLEHWRSILESIVADPEQIVSQIAYLTEAERHQLLVEWNQTELDFSEERCIHQLFEDQVAHSPNSTALIVGEKRYSYDELNQRANRLAHYLRRNDVGPEVLVGICMERSMEMLVCLLAVLKAGGAYVPLDTSYPRERLAIIIEDSNLSILLSQKSLLERLPEHEFKLICWESLELDNELSSNPDCIQDFKNLAYVIFTSGSTGRPKGIAIENRSVVAFAEWGRAAYSREDLDGVLFSTSICFDLSVFELFVTLSCGGKIILAENALELRDLAALDEVRLINTVPSAMTELVRTGPLPSSIRIVNLCGEPLLSSLVDKIYETASIEKVYDLYGPSEDTVYSTFALRKPAARNTIGNPISNAKVYLLDSQLRPVGIGIPGELYIGGKGLARGYFNKPELTEERFIPNPFSDKEEDRLYRTGDLVRYYSNGEIEFIGRTDFQVKIRGFRIELGEIESVLRSLPEVQNALVIAAEDQTEIQHLIAYIATAGMELDQAFIRDQLASKLPEYMLPSYFVFLDAFPLTPNGKVDRKSLPLPEVKTDSTTSVDGEPKSMLEFRLLEIWEELFGRKGIGRFDNFFDIGGHSLLAVRLVGEIEKNLDCKIAISTLFQFPTIEALALRLHSQEWRSEFSSLLPMQIQGNKPPLYFIHGWVGDIFCFVELAKKMGKDQPLYGVQAVGLDGEADRHTSIEEMASHYVREIRAFQPEGPYYLCAYSLGGLIAYEIAQQLQALGAKVGMLALLDTRPNGALPWPVYIRRELPYISAYLVSLIKGFLKQPGEVYRKKLKRISETFRFWCSVNKAKEVAVSTAPKRSREAPVISGFGDYYSAVAFAYKIQSYRGDIDVFISEDVETRYGILPWKYLVKGKSSFHPIQGTHHEILLEENLDGLSKSLLKVLNERQKHEVEKG